MPALRFAITHGPDTDGRYLEAGAAELDILHGRSFLDTDPEISPVEAPIPENSPLCQW
jgi:hypothetical protein